MERKALEPGVTPEKVAAAETAVREELEKGYPLGTQSKKDRRVPESADAPQRVKLSVNWRRSHWLIEEVREDLIYPWKWREAHSV